MPPGPFCKCGKILDIGSLSAAKTGVWLRGDCYVLMAVCYVSMNWSAVLLAQGQHKMRGVPFWGEGTIGDLYERVLLQPWQQRLFARAVA